MILQLAIVVNDKAMHGLNLMSTCFRLGDAVQTRQPDMATNTIQDAGRHPVGRAIG